MDGDLRTMHRSVATDRSPYSAPPRHVTLWQILVWTYREQQAHRYLRSPFDWFIYELSAQEVIEDMPRPAVHADAAAVHRAVCDLGRDDRELVSFYAAIAEMPELPDGEPRPYPMTSEKVSGEDVDEWFAWHEQADGRRLRYLVRVAERIQVRSVPIMRKTGKGKRGKMQVIGFKPVVEEVEFCPLSWEPDPVYLDCMRAIFADWLDAMVRLYAALDGVALKDHALSALGVAAADAEAVYESMVGPSRASDGTVRVEVQLLRGRLASLDGVRLSHRLHARARVDKAG